MTAQEFSDQFDVLYNNITSNQAPGLTEYEKSVFLTKAQNEIVKNYFTAASKGNNIGQGFDDSAKRQADFSCLMKTAGGKEDTNITSKIDNRSVVFSFPTDVFIVVNEVVTVNSRICQVIPLRYDDYTRLMSKPFKRPLKNQAWRLINSSTGSGNEFTKYVEIIPATGTSATTYMVRYIRKPKPIIVGDLDDLTIDGYSYSESSGGGSDTSIDKVATPVISITGNSPVKLSISCSTEGATIYYTTNGNTPTVNDTKYTEPFTFTLTSTIKAIAVKEDMQDSDVVTFSASIPGITRSPQKSETVKTTSGCELDPLLHQDILQRAVELAKVAWTATGQENTQLVMTAGQRSE